MALLTPANASWASAVVGRFNASSGSSLTIGSGTVSAWASMVGSVVLTNTDTTAQPVYTATGFNSGYPAVSFDGSNDYLGSTTNVLNLFNQASVTVMCAGMVNGNGDKRWWSEGNSTTNNTIYAAGQTCPTGGSLTLMATGLIRDSSGNQIKGSNVPYTDIPAAFDNVPHIFGFNDTGPAGKTTIGYTDGNVSAPIAYDSATRATTPIDRFSLGALLRSGAASFAQMMLGEAVFLNRTLTTTERQELEGYLAWQWGLQGKLPAGHAYKTAAPQTASGGSSGSSVGTSTALGAGQANANATGTTSGSSLVTGTGMASAAAAGLAAGGSTVSATSSSKATSAGSAQGISTAAANAMASSAATGLSSGTSTALATSGTPAPTSSGSAFGASSAAAIGQSSVVSTGLAIGQSTSEASGGSKTISVGSSFAISNVSGTARAEVTSAGVSLGACSVQGIGVAASLATGQSYGASMVAAFGLSNSSSVGVSFGSSLAYAYSQQEYIPPNPPPSRVVSSSRNSRIVVTYNFPRIAA